MEKRLALFDIDRTMINGISFIPMLDAQAKEGLIDVSISKRASELHGEYNDSKGNVGYEDYVVGLLDIYAEGLEGKPVNEVAESTDNYFKASKDFFVYVKPTIDLLSDAYDIALVTSNTQFAAASVSKLFGITGFCSTELEIQNNMFTGRIKRFLATSEQKGRAIKPLLENHRHSESLAFGDSGGDYALLSAVDIPICINPNSGLRKIAENHDWIIVDSKRDLSSKLGLTAVRQALIYTGVLRGNSKEISLDKRYHSDQYQTAANVRARFAMYYLEVCEEGEEPFDPDLEVIMAMQELGVSGFASLLDIGSADAQLQELENVVGLNQGLNVASDPNPVLKIRQKIEKRRRRMKIIEERKKQFEGMVFGDIPIVFSETGDITDTSISKNKQSIQSDANNIPFKDKSFDVVTAMNVLYHVEDIEGALKELDRACKKDGYVFVSTSGKNNKAEQRDDELAINSIIEKLTGKPSIEPAKMNDGFTTEKAMKMLLEQFEFVYVLNHEGELLVKDKFSKEIYKGSLLSMYDQYNPLPDWDIFERAVDKIIDQIPDEGKLIQVSRSVFVCGDSEFNPGSEFNKVLPEAKS